MFELHQLEISRHEVEALKICFPDDLTHWPTVVVVPDRPIKCLVLCNVEFWLVAEHGRERRLRVKVNGEHPQSPEGEILGQVEGSGRFRRATFEICDGNYLQLILRLSAHLKVQGL